MILITLGTNRRSQSSEEEGLNTPTKESLEKEPVKLNLHLETSFDWDILTPGTPTQSNEIMERKSPVVPGYVSQTGNSNQIFHDPFEVSI